MKRLGGDEKGGKRIRTKISIFSGRKGMMEGGWEGGRVGGGGGRWSYTSKWRGKEKNRLDACRVDAAM